MMSGLHNQTSNLLSEKKRVAVVSLLASLGLAIVKFAAALFTGSLGMLSEAFSSLVDLGATLATLFAINWAEKPADEDHNFGHAKIENVTALFEGMMLLTIAVFIGYQAITRLLSGHSGVEVTWWAMGILVLSMVIDFNRSRALRKTAVATSSAALAADANHFQADMWSSLAALLGLVGVWLGWQWTDAAAGLVVSVFITRIAWKLATETMATLLDKAPDGVNVEIQKLADQTDGVLAARQIRVRQVGSIMFIAAIADVPRTMPVAAIVAVKDRFIAAIVAKYPEADVSITTNPVELDSESAFDKVALIAAQRKLSIHHLTVQRFQKNLAVSFDLEVEGATPLLEAHEIATGLENAIRSSLGAEVEVESHIEPQPLQLIDGQIAEATIGKTVETFLRKLAKPEKTLSDIHNVRVRKTAGGLFVHYHCRFAPSQTIDVVHSVVDRIENGLQTKFPTIKRVVAHAEPIGHASA